MKQRKFCDAEGSVTVGFSHSDFGFVVHVNGFAHALSYSRRSGAQFWDSLILATCAEHGVKRLYTEDIGPRKQALGVALVDPFSGRHGLIHRP